MQYILLYNTLVIGNSKRHSVNEVSEESDKVLIHLHCAGASLMHLTVWKVWYCIRSNIFHLRYCMQNIDHRA